jgi:xanthine/CO dehydrogenase XdhC/CoxF family maturation factor
MKPFRVVIIQDNQLDGHDIPELIEEMNKLEYTEDVWDNLQVCALACAYCYICWRHIATCILSALAHIFAHRATAVIALTHTHTHDRRMLAICI